MKQFLYYVASVLSTLVFASFVGTMILFARGKWHLGKRILATTAVLGLLLAVAVWLTLLLR